MSGGPSVRRSYPSRIGVTGVSLLVGLGASLAVRAADPHNTIYVVGKYESGKGVLRSYDLSDSNATDQDGRTIPSTAATNGYTGVALDPLTRILYILSLIHI